MPGKPLCANLLYTPCTTPFCPPQPTPLESETPDSEAPSLESPVQKQHSPFFSLHRQPSSSSPRPPLPPPPSPLPAHSPPSSVSYPPPPPPPLLLHLPRLLLVDRHPSPLKLNLRLVIIKPLHHTSSPHSKLRITPRPYPSQHPLQQLYPSLPPPLPIPHLPLLQLFPFRRRRSNDFPPILPLENLQLSFQQRRLIVYLFAFTVPKPDFSELVFAVGFSV